MTAATAVRPLLDAMQIPRTNQPGPHLNVGAGYGKRFKRSMVATSRLRR
jgi:hypothetical protein